MNSIHITSPTNLQFLISTFFEQQSRAGQGRTEHSRAQKQYFRLQPLVSRSSNNAIIDTIIASSRFGALILSFSLKTFNSFAS